MVKTARLSASTELLASEGLSESVAVWEDGLRLDPAPGTFEWWYFDAHFEDGSTAVITFATKPLLERNGPLKPTVSLTITRPDGRKIAQFPVFPPAQFSASKEACDVRIGPNWTRGDLHRYELHAEMQGMSAHLTFTGIVPPWRPGVGKAYFGDPARPGALQSFFAWLPSIPYGTVEGTLVYDGQVHRVQGTGYHDHNWGNLGLNEVMDHWYWGRAHVGDFTLIYVEQVASEAFGFTRLPVLMVAKGSEILLGDGRGLTMASREIVRHPGGRGYPKQVDFYWNQGNESVALRLRRPQILEATSLLLLLPKWKQWVGRRFGNPYYFRFQADLELEIELKQIKAREQGRALYEIMILQGRKHP